MAAKVSTKLTPLTALRPTIRPAHQRYPQPQFVFPVTPPSTGDLNIIGLDKLHEDQTSSLHMSQWTPTPGASPFGNNQYFPDLRDTERPVKHRRALSDSTVHETTAAKESDTGAFKIVISKPGEEQRPRTMEDIDPNSAPLLNVNIPSWRLGTPRFTVRGTPIIRGSSYAPTEEFRMSSASLINRSQIELNSSHPELGLNSRQASSLVVPMLRFSRAASSTTSLPSPRTPKPVHPTYMSNLNIEPAMFDDLTFKPACDDRALVRYSPATGAVTAATPPRLVAEITSPSFLDYELISDFFLTFRAFLEPVDLLRMLIARLRWALDRNDETGMVVRVRTFVALRHWILNYFMDDFVVDYDLRLTFCELLNDFVDELSQCARSRKVQLKILTELKKCWRRVCAHYWDGPEFDDSLDADVPIAPGGIAGHRDPDLDPTFWKEEAELPKLEDVVPLTKNTSSRTSFVADVSRAGHIGDSVVLENRPSTPENQVITGLKEGKHRANSPISMTSLNIVSCSFPSKAMRSAQVPQTHPLAAHPVTTSSIYNTTGPVATTPRTLVGKRVRPNPNHKRNNSLTDSLREHSPDKVFFKDQEFLMSVPYAGSLVRGNLLPPGQPFVDVEHSGYFLDQRQTTVLSPESQAILKERIPASAMSGAGMKKLIGSVRRALSTRAHVVSPTPGMTPALPKGLPTNRLPGTSVIPPYRHRHQGSRPIVRIDLLGAESAEDFKKAIREDAAAEAERQPATALASTSRPQFDATDYSAAQMDSTTFNTLPHGKRPMSDMAITAGSKSIVIVDDTLPYETSTIRRTSGSPQTSIFTDRFRPNGADPTPPNTPPAQSMGGGTPRRSSHLLNAQLVRPSLSEEQLPPFVPDLHTIGPISSGRPSEDRPRTAVSVSQRSNRHYPPIAFSGLRRNKSAKTHQSLSSMLHRRHNSFGSGMRSTIRSFDATTYSEGSVIEDEEPDIPVPQPLRVLRRRPGGDLRAATNVGELDHVTLRRSRSVGSLNTYTESIRSSFIQSPRIDSFGNGEMVSIDYSQRREVFSLGQLTEKPPKRNLSLFSTHSSKPIMRPSFEMEAQKLAQIPDDEDDGGIESALLKLEGKFDNKKAAKLSSVGPPPATQAAYQTFIESNTAGPVFGETEVNEEEKKEHRYQHVDTEGLVPDVDVYEDEQSGFLTPKRPLTEVKSFLSEASQGSYSSTPILARGGTDEANSRAVTEEWTNKSILQDFDDDATPDDEPKGIYKFDDDDDDDENDQPSYFAKQMGTWEKSHTADTAPSLSEQQSFLLDDEEDDDDDSALSSEISMDVMSADFDDDFSPKLKLPAHPLSDTIPTPKRNPPSPPITLVQALEMAPPDYVQVPELHEHQLYSTKPLPPTPETTPTAPYIHSAGTPDDLTGTNEALRLAPKPEEEPRKYSAHLPFILAFDSEILAQQFTLIEKDALNEIDWKELIDMAWKNASHHDSRSWVEFLRNSEAHGVEVVIARFNLVVKWAISEIVMTQHIEERVRCIIKYIHIANHCRRYRNFATCSQLTMALASNEVSRLSRTWEMVPAHDRKTLQDLEKLVTPMRNFYNLRAEMEIGSDTGCIPFVGIYTHDLLYNAQRPSEIAASPTTPPLVNFERCRIAAAVVKTLLRLLEASTKYKFQPIEGITERCLWMSALSDEEIRRHSDSLEA